MLDSLKPLLKSIHLPYLLSLFPNLLFTTFIYMLARLVGDGGVSPSVDPITILSLFIFVVLITIFNPIYLIPYIYMFRNHKRTDNSKYYGLNIVLISIYLSTLITITIQILTFLGVFEDLVLSNNAQNNILTMLVVGSDLFIRLIAYNSMLDNIISGTFFSGSYLGFLLITLFAPIFFIIYGFVYYLRHRVYEIQNYSQYKVFKIQLILIILNLIIIFIIVILNSIHISGQINEAVEKGNLSLCEKVENISSMEKCVSDYIRKEPYFHECNVFSENLYLENFCVEEVSKFNKDWKQCFGLNKSYRIRGCIHGLAVENDYFLDTEVCEALAPEKEDPYPAWGDATICYATLAYKKSDYSLCSRLPEYKDIQTCNRELELLKAYGN